MAGAAVGGEEINGGPFSRNHSASVPKHAAFLRRNGSKPLSGAAKAKPPPAPMFDPRFQFDANESERIGWNRTVPDKRPRACLSSPVYEMPLSSLPKTSIVIVQVS